MSVYIKGMKMPKNCGQCLFKGLSPTGESMVCELTLDTVPWDWKPTDCPLIPVPDHGRLIDADALDYFKDDSGIAVFDFVTRGQIKAAPTIIPAEEESGE